MSLLLWIDNHDTNKSTWILIEPLLKGLQQMAKLHRHISWCESRGVGLPRLESEVFQLLRQLCQCLHLAQKWGIQMQWCLIQSSRTSTNFKETSLMAMVTGSEMPWTRVTDLLKLTFIPKSMHAAAKELQSACASTILWATKAASSP